MNDRQRARFRKWFLKNVPAGFCLDDPHELVERLRRLDRDRVSQQTAQVKASRVRVLGPDVPSDPVREFLVSLVHRFEVTHLSPEEVGPVLVEAAFQLTLRN